MTEQFNFLLADDDTDDGFFFTKALKTILSSAELNIVEDGDKLMKYLDTHLENLPDALFLDINMPRKNGAECLFEIKTNERLKNLPVIVYSTSMHESMADKLYKSGAHYYFQKTNLTELETNLQNLVGLMKNKTFMRPMRKDFVLKTTGA
ncbi:response regulator [Sphingobacteriaceae bacterium]|nr:response regulator [Sphingobacteriaceae bacterium]